MTSHYFEDYHVKYMINSEWDMSELSIKGITKFWNGVMNLVQIIILEAYAFLQYSLTVVAVEIESKVMKL